MTHLASLSGSDLLCKGSRCANEPRPASGGNPLCRVCERGLDSDLARLPALFEECGRSLGGSTQRSAAGRTSGGPMPGLPFNEAAAEVRASILSVLSSWSGLVAEKRAITPPQRDATQLARFLRRHLGWLAANETAAEASREIGRLVADARRVTVLSPRRSVRVGVCVEAGCPGELVALIHAGEIRLQGEIRCTAEAGHQWQADEWLHLGRRLDGPAAGTQSARWLGATEIARLWRVPTGTVYRLANEHRWSRRSVGGRVQYDGSDVERTFSERSGQRA